MKQAHNRQLAKWASRLLHLQATPSGGSLLLRVVVEVELMFLQAVQALASGAATHPHTHSHTHTHTHTLLQDTPCVPGADGFSQQRGCVMSLSEVLNSFRHEQNTDWIWKQHCSSFLWMFLYLVEPWFYSSYVGSVGKPSEKKTLETFSVLDRTLLWWENNSTHNQKAYLTYFLTGRWEDD